MSWFKKFISAVVIFNMSSAPLWAQTLSNQDQAKVQQYKNILEPMGYSLSVDSKNHQILVTDKSTKQVAMEIPLADDVTLRKYSPKSVNKMLLDEMIRIKATAGASFSYSIKHLPPESAIFFMAMGAVVAGQLITNYSQNPIAMQQHLEHSVSPIGVFGFFTFMYAQGFTSNLLTLYFTNPRFQYFIPYIGMSVGMFAQTYLSEVLSNPNVQACGKSMMGYPVTPLEKSAGIAADPCAHAYEELVVNKKIWDYAPGMLSMLMSSGLAGLSQRLITKTVLRLTGVDIALWIMPGTMQIKGVRLALVKGLQIATFVAIDSWLNQKVNYAWKNVFDGAEFYEIQKQLTLSMYSLKKSQWNQQSTTIKAELEDLHKKMSAWRMMNLAEVYEAHQNWSEAIHQLTSMYNSSQNFYKIMGEQINSARFHSDRVSLLTRTYPYNGIKAKDLAEGKEDLYLYNPQFIESMQEESLLDSVAKAEVFIGGDKAQQLTAIQKSSIQKVLLKIKTGNRESRGNALQELSFMIDNSVQGAFLTAHFTDALKEVHTILGSPKPLMEPGRGFLANFEFVPSTAQTVKDVSFYRAVGMFRTPKITDYLLMQMLCGPDSEQSESSIKNSLGFPSVFLPPTVRNLKDTFTTCGGSGLPNLSEQQIYTYSFRDNDGKIYKGVLDYLTHGARTNFVGDASTPNADKWWNQNTGSQMDQAFASYSKAYNEIVAKLIDSIFNKNISPLNRGPVHNGAIESALQELRLFLLIIQEIAQPNSKEFNISIQKITAQPLIITELKEVEAQFTNLKTLLERIKIKKLKGQIAIESDLENYHLEEQQTRVQEALKKASDLLGVGDDSQNAIYHLNGLQKEVVVLSIKKIEELTSEVLMYGVIANAVSWDKIQNLKRVNLEQDKFNNSIQKALAKMRSLTGFSSK